MDGDGGEGTSEEEEKEEGFSFYKKPISNGYKGEGMINMSELLRDEIKKA